MKEKRRESYPSDLTDEQREEIAPLYTGMRKCTWSKRELTDAVLYLVDSGCKWRQLPHDFPPYSTVHSFYCRARISGLWDKILEHLVKREYSTTPNRLEYKRLGLKYGIIGAREMVETAEKACT